MADRTVAQACVGASETPGLEQVTLALSAGVAYGVVVDGWSNTDPDNAV